MSEIPQSYVPQDGKLFSISMGLRTLAERDWLEVDKHFAREIALKQHLFASQPNQVFQATDAGLQGSQETLELITSHLHTFYADSTTVTRNFVDVSTDKSQDFLGHPLVSASLLVQEDLCVMSKIDGQWVLTAAVVCFPSRWDLTTKIGTNLHEIHSPVPQYEERIGAATDAMFDKFTVDRAVWRINWTILDQPDLHQPASSHQQHEPSQILSESSGDFAANTFLRIERQTLRVLPQSKDVLFTIRTYVDSLEHVAHTYPDFQTQLQATLAGVSADTKSYKGWDKMWPKLMDWSTEAK